MLGHLPEIICILKVRTAIRGILAFEIEVSTSLAGSIAIAFDLTPLAFVARYSQSVEVIFSEQDNSPCPNESQQSRSNC